MFNKGSFPTFTPLSIEVQKMKIVVQMKKYQLWYSFLVFSYL